MGRKKKQKPKPAEPADDDVGPEVAPDVAESPDALQQLSDAFAEMAGGETEAVEPADDETLEEEHRHVEAEAPPTGLSPRTIVEGMLFVGHSENEPLATSQVAELIRGVEPDEVDQIVGELNEAYTADGCPYVIKAEGQGYRLVLRDELDGVRDRFYGKLREARLSQAAVDVLALVAYNQPIGADDVTQMRGTASGGILRQLVRRGLLRLERQEQSRPPIFYTTDRFLKLFHLDSIEDLPRVED